MVTLVLVAVVLAGWTIADGRTDLLPLGLQGMRPNAAVAFGALALTWFLPVALARLLAVLALAVAATSLALNVLGYRTVLEVLFGLREPSPGRTVVVTGAAVGLLAVARLVALVRAADRRRVRRTVEVIGLTGFAAATVCVFAYLLYARSFSADGPLSTLALPCACAIVLCSLALLADVEGGFLGWVVHGADAGAVLLRRILPVCLLAPPVLAFAAFRASRAGWFGADFTLAGAVVATVALGSLALVYTARVLRREEHRRALTASALVSVGDDLEQRVREQSTELLAARVREAVLADRERLAADLHDVVIQRLFAVALDLQRTESPDAAAVDAAVDGLDAAIRDLRAAIFDLRSAPAQGLAEALAEIVASAAPAFAVAPTLTISGGLEAVAADTAGHLLAAAREGVSNAARHSHGRQLSVDVGVEGGALTLTVVDDGIGVDPARATSGMLNVRERAVQLGGWCAWAPDGDSGTAMVWRVPVGRTAPDPSVTGTAQLVAQLRAVTAEVLRCRVTDRIDVVLENLRALTSADVSGLLTPEGEGVRVRAACGFDDEHDIRDLYLPASEALSIRVLSSMRPLRISGVDNMPALADVPSLGLDAGMLVPIEGPGTQGVLVVGRRSGRAPFSQTDENAATIFATHVAALLSLGPAVDGVRAWPRTEYDYSDVLTRPAKGLRPFYGLGRKP